MALAVTACSRDQPTHKEWVVSIRGYGPIEAGMTIGEASAAGGRPLASPAPGSESCDFVGFVDDSVPAIRFMTMDGRITRVDVNDTTISTVHDIRIGDTEARVQKAYRGRIRVEPHKYEQGHYLIVGPAIQADSGFELVFETDGQRVTRYRAGQVPEVELVEGCS